MPGAPDAGAASGGDDADAPLLEVRVTRTGGVAGIRMRWHAEARDAADVEAWARLLDECPWDATGGDGGATRDGFATVIEVLDRRDPAHPSVRTARLGEPAPEPWRALTERVRAASRR